eukprot:2111539-Alexandrium_andersonii.AAC.1
MPYHGPWSAIGLSRSCWVFLQQLSSSCACSSCSTQLQRDARYVPTPPCVCVRTDPAPSGARDLLLQVPLLRPGPHGRSRLRARRVGLRCCALAGLVV